MATFDVLNTAGDVVGSAEVPDSIFAAEVKEHLHWEVVRWQEAKACAGTHKVKTKSEVRGGGRKPWSQKGTGNARWLQPFLYGSVVVPFMADTSGSWFLGEQKGSSFCVVLCLEPKGTG